MLETSFPLGGHSLIINRSKGPRTCQTSVYSGMAALQIESAESQPYVRLSCVFFLFPHATLIRCLEPPALHIHPRRLLHPTYARLYMYAYCKHMHVSSIASVHPSNRYLTGYTVD